MYTKLKIYILALGCLFIGLYYSIGALDVDTFNPLYPYAGLSLIMVFIVLHQGIKKVHLKGIIPFIIFISYIFLTITWTSTFEYGYIKAINLLGLNIFFIGTALMIIKDFYKFNIFIVIGLLLSILIIFVGIGSPGEVLARLAIIGRLGGVEDSVGIIGISRYLGFSNLCVYYVFTRTKTKFVKGLLIVIFMLSTTYMIFSGTRGGIYGFIISFLFILFHRAKGADKRFSYGIVIMVLGVLLYFLFEQFSGDIFYNFVMDRLNSESGNIRLMIFKDTILGYFNLNFLHKIIGAGSGSASTVIMNSTGAVTTQGFHRVYPHNILLEILYEYGLIGLILFVWVCILPIILTFKLRQTNFASIFLMGYWIFWFFNSMVSGDILANYFLFGISIILMVNYNSRIYLRD